MMKHEEDGNKINSLLDSGTILELIFSEYMPEGV